MQYIGVSYFIVVVMTVACHFHPDTVDDEKRRVIKKHTIKKTLAIILMTCYKYITDIF